jgi:hypothetical protein
MSWKGEYVFAVDAGASHLQMLRPPANHIFRCRGRLLFASEAGVRLYARILPAHLV